MTDTLPTRKELKQLYDEKGKEALVWYAWRNSLRTLPLLGSLPLRDIWEEDTVKHVFSVCRVSLLMANIPALGMPAAVTATDAATATGTAAKAATATTYAAKVATYAANTSFYTDTAVYISFIETADNADAPYTANAAYIAAEVAARGTYAARATYAARTDYNFLINNTHKGQVYWFSQPLWKKQWLGSLSPKSFDVNLSKFSTELKNLGLDFLANDLELLYQGVGRPEQKHWKQYLENPSDVVFESAESLRRFIFEESEQINAVRVLLLGPGGAGKTTLKDRFQGETEVKHHKATVGIEYLDHQPLQLDKNKGAFSGREFSDDLQLFLWDFGGQTLFHGLHNAFLHENCVYVLVVDSRHEQEPDEWLQQIRHTAGSNTLPPVHIVTNIYENCDRKQNENRLKALYTGELHFHYFACNELESDELTEFKQSLLNSASTQRHSVTKRLVDAGKQLVKTLKHDPVISVAALRKHVRKTFKENEINDTVKQLEGLGYLVPANDQRKKYCLNPTWTIDHAYQFLHMPVVQSSEGLLDQDVFADKALELSETIAEKQDDKDYPKLNEQRIEYLESFIQGSGVCVALEQTHQFFFPDVAPANEPEDYVKPKAECRAVIEFILPYIPIGLSAQLVCHWMQQQDICITTPNDVWREGFVLCESENESNHLIVRYQHRKAVISVDCFGEQKAIADLLKNFWKGLQDKIKPINADDIIPLIRMDQVILEKNKHLIEATEWLGDADKIIATLDQIKQLKRDVERGKTVTTNTMNNYGTTGIVSFGNDNDIEQKDVTFTGVKEENHKDLLLQAIQQVRVDYVHKLVAEHHQQLVIMENQINVGKLQESWYQTLLPDLTTAANVATVVSGIATMLGLI